MSNRTLLLIAALALWACIAIPTSARAHQAPPPDDYLDGIRDVRGPPPPPPSPVPATHRRAARLLSIDSEVVGILIADDRVWYPSAVSALSACAGSRCAPVVRTEEQSCAAPRCPGSGNVLVLAHSIAEVGDFPSGREDYQRVISELAADPGLASVAAFFQGHPEPPPGPTYFDTNDEDVRWELSAAGGGAYLVEGGAPVGLVSLSGGFRFRWDSHRGDDDVLAILWGNSLGFDLRVHMLFGVPLQSDATTTAVLVGIAPATAYALRHDVIRMPTAYSFVVPEVGVAIREDRSPTWYVAWQLPLAVLVDEHVAFEARANLMMIGDWPGREDTVEGVIGATAAFILR